MTSGRRPKTLTTTPDRSVSSTPSGPPLQTGRLRPEHGPSAAPEPDSAARREIVRIEQAIRAKDERVLKEYGATGRLGVSTKFRTIWAVAAMAVEWSRRLSALHDC